MPPKRWYVVLIAYALLPIARANAPIVLPGTQPGSTTIAKHKPYEAVPGAPIAE